METLNRENKFNYIHSFDSIRGFAAFIVLLLHGTYGIFRGGWIGVDLFFVLSGYLITSLLEKEYLKFGNISLIKFYSRRALRLIPPLIICILISNILWSYTILYPGADRLMANVSGLFYFANFIRGNVSGNMSHLWSLSVEEHFYFLWPILVLYFVFKMPGKKRIIFISLFILIIICFRLFIFGFNPPPSYGIFIIDPDRFTFCRMDNILLGALLSFILTKNKEFNFNKKSTVNILLLIILLLFSIILVTLSNDNPFHNTGGFILTNILCCSLIFIAIKQQDHFVFSNKILIWMGKRSYGIYVYHFPIFLFLEKYREHHSISNFIFITILRFGLSFIVAELSYRYIEQPILKLKKRYEV